MKEQMNMCYKQGNEKEHEGWAGGCIRKGVHGRPGWLASNDSAVIAQEKHHKAAILLYPPRVSPTRHLCRSLATPKRREEMAAGSSQC